MEAYIERKGLAGMGRLPAAEGGAMAGWYLSEQARKALRTARGLARSQRAAGSADPLLVAILGQWDDELAAARPSCGPAA